MKFWPDNVYDRTQSVGLIISLSGLNASIWTRPLGPWEWVAFGLDLGLLLAMWGTRSARKLIEMQRLVISHYETREMLRATFREAQHPIANDWRNS